MHQIGVGVLGPVFRTYDPEQARLFAVKAFHVDITPEQARTLVEILDQLVHTGLTHPGIVAPVAAGLEDGVPYLAQEYVAAESLDVAMRHYAPVSIATALPLVEQLAEALDAAHGRGVCHGGLHLRDVFVTPEGARLTGCGVVPALEQVGLDGPIRRPYTAPEMIAGRRWGPEADRFALVAIAYELLTGKRAAGTGSQVTSRLDTVNDVVDGEALQSVFASGLSDTPDARYASAIRFSSDLRAAVGTDLHDEDETVGETTVPLVQKSSDVSTSAVSGTDAFDLLDTLKLHDTTSEGLEESGAPDATEAFDTDNADIAGGGDVADEGPAGHEASEVDETSEVPVSERMSDVSDLPDLPPLPHPPATGRWPEAPDAEGPQGLTGDEEPTDLLDEADSLDPRLPVSTAGTSASRHSWLSRSSAALLVVLAVAATVAYGVGLRFGGQRSPVDTVAGEPGLSMAVTQGLNDVVLEEVLGKVEDVVADAVVEPLGAEPERVAPPLPPELPRRQQAAAPRVSEGTVPAVAARAQAPTDGPSPVVPTREPGAGWLLVRTAPPGAVVTLEGVDRGQTPLSLRDVPFGTHRIVVSHAGFRTETREVTLSAAGTVAAVGLDLLPVPDGLAVDPALSSVAVESRPAGARVILDGQLVGTTPTVLSDVSPGAHQLRLERDGYQAWVMTIDVPSADEIRIAASLDQLSR